MTSDSTIEVLQGELERLFELDEMVRLSADVLGFDPERIGSTRSKGAFARALVGYCVDQEATEALVDAILLSSSQADVGLRQVAKQAPNGELRPGTRVAGMRIVKKIGEGGLSIVYLAEGETVDGETQRAAVKVIRPQFARDRAAVHRFTTVNRVMQSLQSPGLVQILGVGHLEDSRPWVAAAYLSGQTLAQRIERTGSLHINEAKPLFVGLLQGLVALHKRGVLHGDVKVENVFVARGTGSDGSSEPIGVLVDGGGDRLLTRVQLGAGTTGLLPVLGTAKAIAPEQARGAEADPRTDIYQAGTLMYETLTGRPPFIGGSAIDVIAQHLSATPQPPSAHARKGWVSAALDEVILRTLAKDPAQRYQTAEALLDALERAIRRPIVQRPLDEGVFQDARRTLLANPDNTEVAERVEELAGAAGVLSRAAEVLREAAGAADDNETRLLLLFRVARIYDIELKDPLRSESAYQRILEIDPGNEVALRGVEAQKRASGDHEGLVGLLLDRIERETDAQPRKALLQEVATLYEKHLRDPGNALFALSQALITAPGDVDLGKHIERLAGNDPARWNELLETLSASAQQAHATLFTDEQSQRQAAADQLALAQQTQNDVRAAVDAEVASYQEAVSQQQAVAHSEVVEAEQALEATKFELEEAEARLDDTAKQVGELTEYAQAQRQAAEEASAKAESHVQAYEQLEQEAGAAPSPDQQAELTRIAAEAEALVAGAEQQEADSEQAAANLEAAREGLSEVQQVLEAAQQRVAEAETRLTAVRERLGVPHGEAGPTPEQRARLTAADHAVNAALAALEAFESRDAIEAANKRDHDLHTLATTYVRMGRWYGERLSRPDFALSCLSQALTVDPSCDPAYDALVDLYRNSQSWPELVATLLQRADRAKSPLKGRDYRAEAAAIIAGKLNDQPQARTQLERVLADDPEHPEAQKQLGEILRDQEDWSALAAILERRANALKGQERGELFAQLGELYEDREGDLDRAELKYRAAIEAHPRMLNAWKGLERVAARKENYEGLVESLRAQVDLAPTPKQRIALLERIGALLEEEFVDHAQAAECFEDVVSVDAGHEAANAALARLYRHLQRYEDLVEVLDRHAGTVADPGRKVELMLQAARVFSVDIGSPERAIDLYEDVLHIDEQQNEALTEVARLKSTAGDVGAAVSAVERLADQEHDPGKRALLFVRAGKLLADSGNRDGAIERYKKALDLEPHLVDATDALRDIYKQRGDARGAAEMLLHAIQIADGDLRRAALLGELGELYRDQLDSAEQAQDAFVQALELDPTRTVAAAGLARLAHVQGQHHDAVEYYAQIERRLEELPAADAAAICTEISESYRALEQNVQAVAALKRACELTPDALPALERYAQLLIETDDAGAAERTYEGMIEQFGDELDAAGRVRLLLALGGARIAAKKGKRALDTFQQVLDLKPDDEDALEGMTRAYEQQGNWTEVVNLLQLRARKADTEDASFDLLVRTGDVFLEHLGDREAATQTYVMALDVKPDSRNLLTKLMAVYSDAKDWPRLIEIILRIAAMVQDAGQLAKYYNTAATIAHVELGRFDEAANYYEEALAYLPTEAGDAQFDGLVQCLTENQDWERLERAYEARITRLKQASAEPQRIALLLDACGDIVNNRLNRLVDALRMYEEALGLDPQNGDRRAALTTIYSKEPKRFFERAVASHRHYLDEDPYKVESLQSLRKIYTSGKKPDESWCMCQALRCLKMADADEEKFFKKYRLTRLPKMKQPITDDLWRDLLLHPGQDLTLTAIFAALQPAIIAAQAQQLHALGIHEQHRIDPINDPNAMPRMLVHVAENTATHLPPMYYSPRDPGGLSFLFTSPPAIGVGAGAQAGGPQQALAFVAGRHLSYYRPGQYFRQLVPTGTGLRAWLLGAIRTVSPHFPAPANMEGQVKEAAAAIQHALVGPHRDALRSLTQKLLEAAPELDMRAWMAGVDLTADRVGFVLSNDLKIANAVIEASPEDSSSVGRKQRLKELLAYSISEPYFELRKRLGIALGG